MKLLTLDEAMAAHPRCYRVSVMSQWIIAVVLGQIIGWLCWLGLFWALIVNDLRKALKPTAWVAATADDGVFIKWRSYQNLGWDVDDAQVLFLPWREIRRIRRHDRTWITPSGDRSRRRDRRHRTGGGREGRPVSCNGTSSVSVFVSHYCVLICFH